MGEHRFFSRTPTEQAGTERAAAERAGAERTEVVVASRSQVDGRVAPWSARTDAAVKWVGWHLVEIAVVGGSALLAVAAHPWWSVVTLLAAAGWVAHERTSRRRHTDATADAEPGVPTAQATRDAADEARDVPGGDAGWTA